MSLPKEFVKELTIPILFKKTRLNEQTMEYISAWFFMEIKLKVNSDRKDTWLSYLEKSPRKPIFVHQKFGSDYLCCEFVLAESSCQTYGVSMEKSKPKRVEDSDLKELIVEKKPKISKTENLAEVQL